MAQQIAGGVLGDGQAHVLPDAPVDGRCFAVALAGLGMGVDVARLRRLGHRPLLLGLASWVMIGAVSYAGVRLVA